MTSFFNHVLNFPKCPIFSNVLINDIWDKGQHSSNYIICKICPHCPTRSLWVTNVNVSVNVLTQLKNVLTTQKVSKLFPNILIVHNEVRLLVKVPPSPKQKKTSSLQAENVLRQKNKKEKGLHLKTVPSVKVVHKDPRVLTETDAHSDLVPASEDAFKQ